MENRGIVGLALGGLLLLTAAACSNAATPSPAGDAKPSAAGVAPSSSAVTRKDKINVRMLDNPQGFDPATLFRIETEDVAFNIYSALVMYDATTGEIVPDLAEKYETNDAITWTFHLRKGVQWQKGYGELTSADVVYSYKRILDPATASPYRGEFSNVADVNAPDPYTVAITLKTPDAGFLHQVASYHQGQIVKKEAVEKYGSQYQMNPVGTGPFSMDKFTPNSEVVLTRNDAYYKGPAKLKTVDMRIIKDDATSEVALKNGEVDAAERIGSNEALTRLSKDSNFTMYKVDNVAISLTMLNLEYPPLSKVQVRQAIAYAMDWPAIVKATTPLTTQPTTNLMPSWMPVYTDKVPTYPYNPEKAKALLIEAGYPDGFSVKSLGSSASGISDASLLQQSYLAKVGIKLDFELVETTVFNTRRNSGDFQMSGRLLPAVNPDTILFSYLHPDNIAPKGLNGARYNNPELTKLLEQARAERDPQKRKDLYAQVQVIALTDLPYIPTTSSTSYWPAWNYVKGIVINRLVDVDFWPVTVEAK